MHSGDRWRLGHRPGLDGLRGVAILLVVAAHYTAEVQVRSVGIAGVTVFFVLSGFLITSLLAGEHATSGRISLRAFYARRARRLLPALGLMMAFVAAAYAVIGIPFDGLVTVALYIGNWPRAFVHPMRFLDHTWSLAVEEQFYILWPLVLILALRWSRRGALYVALAGVALSVALRFELWTGVGRQNRVWFGTDTNAYALLAGCALSLWMLDRPTGRNRPRVAAGLLAVLVVVASVANSWAAYTLLVPPLAAAVTVGMIWCLCRDGATGWSTVPALRFIGRRSYGYYLWHIPLLLTAHRIAGGVSVASNLLALAATVSVAEASWWLVESPILHGRRQATQPHVPEIVLGPETEFHRRATWVGDRA